MLKKLLVSYTNIILLTIISVPVGAIVGLIDTLFGSILLLVTDIRMENSYILIPFLGVAGIGILWCYRKFGGESNKGMSLIFEAGHGSNVNIPIRMILFTIIGTWFTHLFGGSAGREGVAIQIGGTVAHRISKQLPIKVDKKLIIIIGMAAGFSGLFRTPIAATFFAVEVLTAGILEHKAILPALTASYIASYISGLLGIEKFQFILTDTVVFSWMFILKFIIIGILFGITGRVFSLCLHRTKNLLPKYNPFFKIFIVGTTISCFSLLCWNGRYSGLGTNLIAMSFSNGIYPWDFALKFLFTIFTLSVGFQGGEVTPLFSIGASLGFVLASIFHLPCSFIAALGYIAVFASATNTLIAPIMIGSEIFGYEYLPYFVAICILSYVFNGNVSIYSLQKTST